MSSVLLKFKRIIGGLCASYMSAGILIDRFDMNFIVGS